MTPRAAALRSGEDRVIRASGTVALSLVGALLSPGTRRHDDRARSPIRHLNRPTDLPPRRGRSRPLRRRDGGGRSPRQPGDEYRDARGTTSSRSRRSTRRMPRSGCRRTILYAMIAFAGWLAWKATDDLSPTIAWLVQMALNLGWTVVFFGWRAPEAAIVVIAALSWSPWRSTSCCHGGHRSPPVRCSCPTSPGSASPPPSTSAWLCSTSAHHVRLSSLPVLNSPLR